MGEKRPSCELWVDRPIDDLRNVPVEAERTTLSSVLWMGEGDESIGFAFDGRGTAENPRRAMLGATIDRQPRPAVAQRWPFAKFGVGVSSVSRVLAKNDDVMDECG